jgi:hypothetical protein
MIQMRTVGLIAHGMVIQAILRLNKVRGNPEYLLPQMSRSLQEIARCISPIYKSGIWEPYPYPMIPMEMRFRRYALKPMVSRQPTTTLGRSVMVERSTSSEQIPLMMILMATCFLTGGSMIEAGMNPMTIGHLSCTSRFHGRISVRPRNH